MPTSSANELTPEERVQARADGWDFHGGLFRTVADRRGVYRFFAIRHVVMHCRQKARTSALHRKAFSFSRWTEAHDLVATIDGWRLSHDHVRIISNYLLTSQDTVAEYVAARAEKDPLAALALRTIAIKKLTRGSTNG